MQGHIESAFDCKFIHEMPHRQRSRQLDPYAVQPWEKTTLQLDFSESSQQKKYKTYYQSPNNRTLGDRRDKKYSTHRVFSFRKDNQLPKASPQRIKRQSNNQKMSIVSEKSVVTHYNINGNFLSQNCTIDKRRFSNQFFLRAKKREKDRVVSRQKQPEVTLGVSSIDEIRKRLNFSKEISSFQDNKYVRLNSENDMMQGNFMTSIHTISGRRKSKVISLGFHKLSVPRGIIKQNSVNLQAFFPF